MRSHLTTALAAAWNDRSGPSVLRIRLAADDFSRPLSRLGAMMQKTVVQK